MSFQTTESYKKQRVELRSLLIKYFSLQDLQELCFDLHVPYDEIRGEGNQSNVVMNLIIHQENRLNLHELVTTAKRKRPQVDWPNFAKMSSTPVEYELTTSDKDSLEPDFGVVTGFTDLDRMTGGYHKGTLNLVACRPGMGKSSFVLSISLVSSLKYQQSVIYFSLQMSSSRLKKRIITADARIDYRRLSSGSLEEHEREIYNEALHRLNNAKLRIIDSSFLTPTQIRETCSEIRKKSDLNFVVIDGFEFIQPDVRFQTIHEERSEIGRWLKNLALEINAPIVVTCSVSSRVEKRIDKRPQLIDLPSDLGQYADTVAFIYRDEYYNPYTTERPNITELIIEKNNDGNTGTIDLYWHAKLMTFRNLQRQEITL